MGARIINLIGSTLIEHKQTVVIKDSKICFHVMNSLTRWRVKTLLSKEPETIEWIFSFEEGSVFWDVGANIGLYSCIAAKYAGCNVFAFEPSVFNLQLLAQNISTNNLSSKVAIVPLAVTDHAKVGALKFSNIHWGGALSTFDEDFGWDGKAIDKVFEYQIAGISMDQAKEIFSLPNPKYLKIDVDGLEHFVLAGGQKILASTDEVLVEINDEFSEQKVNSENLLKSLGFKREIKTHSDLVENAPGFSSTFNQIWKRC